MVLSWSASWFWSPAQSCWLLRPRGRIRRGQGQEEIGQFLLLLGGDLYRRQRWNEGEGHRNALMCPPKGAMAVPAIPSLMVWNRSWSAWSGTCTTRSAGGGRSPGAIGVSLKHPQIHTILQPFIRWLDHKARHKAV